MDLSTALVKIGHEVYLFSPHLSQEFIEIAKSKNFVVIDKINKFEKFDLLILSHWQALKSHINDVIENFDKIINIIHSEIYEVEAPALELKIDKYICVRDSIKQMLLIEYKIPEINIEVIFNPINTSIFNRLSCSDKKYGLFVGTYSNVRHNAMVKFSDYCKRNNLKSIFVGFNHNLVNFFDKTLPTTTDIVSLVKNASICGGIIFGRTYWEAKLCGKPTIEYLIDKNGNVTEEIQDDKIESWDELYYKLNYVEVAQKVLDSVGIKIDSNMTKIKNFSLAQLEHEANLVIQKIIKINKIDITQWERKKLRQIDLICIDTLQPQEAFKSLLICNYFFDFDKLIMLSNSILPKINKYGIKHYYIDEITRKDYSDYCFHISDYSNNDYTLVIQHDGFICNPKLWDDEYLEYDYIGAPFNNFAMSFCQEFMEKPCTNRIGNGGFSLRTKKLNNFMKTISTFPRIREEEDIVLCIQYYDLACKKGLKFAPENLARKFSYESDMVADRWVITHEFDPTKNFGFHQNSNKLKLLENLKFELQNKHFTDYLVKSEVSNFYDLPNEKFYLQPNKVELEELSIFIPVTFDSIERFNNLISVINNIKTFFNVKIYVLITEKIGSINLKIDNNLVDEVFYLKSNDKQFSKGKICNFFLKNKIKTKFGLYIEPDFLVHPQGIFDCYNVLKDNKFKFAFPFNGMALYLSKEQSLNFDPIKEKLPIWKILFNIDKPSVYLEKPIDITYLHVGFSFMFEVESYKNCGFENENFKYWGCDDNEKIVRICKLGYDYFFAKNYGFHLWHPRSSNYYKNYNEVMHELNRITSMNYEELLAEIQDWNKNAPLN